MNTYFPMGVGAAGFRCWWRLLHGSDANLDNAHLMRLASRFSRRLRAWAKAHQVAVSDCSAGERKHQITAQYLLTHQVPAGLFMNSCQLKHGPKPNIATALDQHYERLQVGMQGLFTEIGIAA